MSCDRSAAVCIRCGLVQQISRKYTCQDIPVLLKIASSRKFLLKEFRKSDSDPNEVPPFININECATHVLKIWQEAKSKDISFMEEFQALPNMYFRKRFIKRVLAGCIEPCSESVTVTQKQCVDHCKYLLNKYHDDSVKDKHEEYLQDFTPGMIYRKQIIRLARAELCPL
jgi:hypothetical protein